MGYKNVCLNCRKAFNIGTNFMNFRKADCPECGNAMTLLNHKFKPPKKDDIEKWKVVKFLVENRFIYHHVYEKVEIKNNVEIGYQNYVPYPETLKEAKEFVEKYKMQAIKTK